MSTTPYFLNIKTKFDPISSTGIIKAVFDNEIEFESYSDLYTKVKSILKENPDKKLISFSVDTAISSATIAAVNEQFLSIEPNPNTMNNSAAYKSSMKIIYIDSRPDIKSLVMNDEGKFKQKEFRDSVVSNLLGLNKTEYDDSFTYTRHQASITPSQFIMLGLNEILLEPTEKEELLRMDIPFYSYQLSKDKMPQVINKIKSLVKSEPVYIIFDLSVFDRDIMPLSTRDVTDKSMFGLNLDHLKMITEGFKDINIVGLDITGYFLSCKDSEPAFKISCETIQRIYGKMLNMKESKLNIFNENSRFLIFKELNSYDFGWNIFRGVPEDIKDMLLSKLKDNKFLFLDQENGEVGEINENIEYNEDDINPNHIVISCTTMLEQNDISFYSAQSQFDKTLYPGEKSSMLFELLNKDVITI